MNKDRAGFNIHRWLIALTCLIAVPTLPADESDFPKPFDTQKVEGAGLRPAEDVLKTFKLPPGFQVSLVASEPMVQQPIAMALDARGRLWVAENYTYAEREVNFDKRLRDRIVILEDEDGDGRADRRKVFWDGAQKLTSIEIGFGGVWALCTPYLLFLPDADHDDQLDGEPVVVLDGWDEDAVRHNIVNGLRWGPDGWLYGRHGILATSRVGKPHTPPNERVAINCGIWRYHPQRQVFEAVAHGTTNSWGMDWDEYGEMFFINTVIGHLWHVIPGAHYERMYGEDLQAHLYQLIPQTADHVHWNTKEAWSDIRQGMSATTDHAGGGHAHSGLMIYLGDNWPEEMRGDMFAINFHGRRLNHDRFARRGASYTATHGEDMMFVGDEWFRGIDLLYGPDGGVLVADWTDIGECHENDGVHRTSGRIFKITYGETRRQKSFDLARASNEELVTQQLHHNDWYVREARHVLHERAAAGEDMSDARARLETIYNKSPDVKQRLRAMWSLYCIDATTDDWLRKQLSDSDEHVRVWAVKMLSDKPSLSAGTMAALVDQATQESSGLVLLHIASALQRVAPADRWRLAGKLAARSELADDPVFPKMLWYGSEPAVLANQTEAAGVAIHANIPLLRENIARRATEELATNSEAIEIILQALPDVADVQAQRDLLSGMSAAMRGWRKASAPATWQRVSERLMKSSDAQVVRLAREIAVVFGDGRALDELRTIAASNAADLDSRRGALRALVESRDASIIPLLQELLANRDLALDAVRGLAAYSADAIPPVLVEKYGSLPGPARPETINTLVSRPAYARALLTAVAAGTVPRVDVSAFQIRQMRGFADDELNRQLDELWPELREITTIKAQRIAEVKSSLGEAVLTAANKVNGRRIFQRSCISCHMLFGTGGHVGPDLTGGQRSNLNYLLENIIDPSAQVAENFRMSILVLADGRVINGVIGERLPKTLSVQTPTEKLVLPLDDVDEIRASNLSMMPDQLLDGLRETEVRDLVAYLMSPTQIALPEDGAGP